MNEINKDYKNFYEVLKMDREKDIIIVDPFIVAIPDLIANGVKNIVRIRRPGWGRGSISEFINKVEPKEFKALLEELIKNDPAT